MNWFTGVVLYVLIWWTALFAVLPFGTRPVADADPPTGWRGVPAQPRMGLQGAGDDAGCGADLGAVLPADQQPLAELPVGVAGAYQPSG